MDLRAEEKELVEALVVANSSEKGFNFLIGDLLPGDLLQSVFGGESFCVQPVEFDMFDILVEIGVFKSRGECKRNWKKSDQFIENGCHSFLVFKRDLPLFIFKPIPSLGLNL